MAGGRERGKHTLQMIGMGPSRHVCQGGPWIPRLAVSKGGRKIITGLYLADFAAVSAQRMSQHSMKKYDTLNATSLTAPNTGGAE